MLKSKPVLELGYSKMKKLQTLLGIAALTLSASVFAQAYPNKPITLVIPFAAGSGTDGVARNVAQKLSERLKQPVIVDNKAGAGGAIAAMSVAKAVPDGTTLLFTTSTFITHAASEPTPSYNPLRDFAPIAMLGRGPLLVVSSKASGIQSIAQLIKEARANPGGLTYCSAGPGSINHLAGELFTQMAGITMTHVPYKGSGPATIDLLAGRTQIFFATVPTIRSHVQEDKVNVLAVTSRSRSTMYPAVPTVEESGITGYEVSTWWGLTAPAGTPQETIVALNTVINAVSPALKDRLLNEGATPVSDSPAFFAKTLEAELKAWRNVIHKG
jgi:tripartite-type tricarboxylate transporter receptor subunit TctC